MMISLSLSLSLLRVSVWVFVHMCKAQEVYKAPDWGKKTEGRKMMMVLVCRSLASPPCVGTRRSQFLFFTLALCWDEQTIWVDSCPGLPHTLVSRLKTNRSKINTVRMDF